ncbi:MAG: RNA 3'-terminal phosphate cyclase [Nanoarchaeota archaeon]|nr:RNA 3'-terminal phosphate cyclase [Nanoarchaeota archaeon]MBU1631891.1 RNA 3'-terminal phosphate cyclase [Nanoarchaeota archaeon]MBU1875922.1 RNA 3'-terminal phosphate cyclase [Nanoarchaeota archaeon]
MIELDGSYLEGGGSLVRVALALSALTGKEFKVTGIRSGRPNPGLKAQHLHGIKALKEICNAETNEIEIGATELNFRPGKVKKGIYEIDIGTAGSITLLSQALILPCLFAPAKTTINIKGGTCGKWQASVDYLQNILLPHLQRFVDKIELKILKRGYYPKGGGLVSLQITPRFKIKDFNTFEQFYEELQFKTSKIRLIEQGKLEQIRGIVNVSSELQEKEIAERISKSSKGILKDYEVPINIRVEYANALSIGGEIVVWGISSNNGKVDFDNPIILGGDALVEKNKSSEEIGKEAAEELKEEIESGAAVDRHLADQLISFMGLLPGSEIKTSEVSKHTKTNIYVVEKFLPVGFKVEGNKINVYKR